MSVYPCSRRAKGLLIPLFGALVLPGLSARAEPTGSGPHGPGASTGAPGPLRQLAERLSRRWEVVVLVDPAVPRMSLREIPADDLPAEQALDLALASHRRIAWRRVLLPSGQGGLPSVEALAAAARAAEQPGMGSLVIEDAQAKQLTAYLKDQPLSPADKGVPEKPRSKSIPLYLVFSRVTPPDGDAPAQQFADLQRQQLELPVQPQHRALAMVQVAQLLGAMPRADMEAFANRTLHAGMPLWESTPPEQRQEMIQQTLQLMKAFDAGIQRDAARAAVPSRPVSTAPARRSDPKALAAAMAERYQVTVLVDPALPMASPVSLPARDAPMEEALAQIAAALPGSAWRRVYLPEAQRKRLPSAAKLATWVRTLERLETGSLALQDPAARHEISYRKDEPAASLTSLRRQGGLAEQPIYLLVSTTPSARGGTPEERLLDLQRQQIGLMLRLSPEQMGQSMARAIRAFPSADAETRSRLLGLPAMAGLMATWMPRAAKERGQPLAPQ
jgi:hypothetical protein